MTSLREFNPAIVTRAHFIPDVPRGSQLLLVGTDPNTEQLEEALQAIGIGLKTVNSMTEACDCVKSGRFQAVFSKPLLSDGSWKRLIDMAHHCDLGFEVVLVARGCDLTGWAEALEEGVFDIIDGLRYLPRVTAVAKRAVWAAYLKGAGPNPTATGPQRAA